MTLHNYICKFSTGKGFNLELADTIGIAESTLYKYINKERVPRLDIAIKINAATGGLVDYSDMLTEELSANLNIGNDSKIEDLL